MLLPEMQRRNKVGGLVDRRIGEGDLGMTAEERAVQRFAQEKQRRKGASLFDLEGSDDGEPRVGLTHGGRSLDDLAVDDFGDEKSEEGVSEDDGELMRRKRKRENAAEDDGDDVDEEVADEQPECKKTKKEVMEEVIAKSKLHKYERQKAKEDDDDLREELDKGADDMLAMLRGQRLRPPAPKPEEPQQDGREPIMNPERQKLLDGVDPARVNREYDARLKTLAQDTKAKPSDRTKTEEEKVREEAERLKELEGRRVKRMRGEEISDDEADNEMEDADVGDVGDNNEIPDEAAAFGFTNAYAQSNQDKEKLVLEGEDDFALDEDLIASGSEADLSEQSTSENDSNIEDDIHPTEEDEEDEFVKGYLDAKLDTGGRANGIPNGDKGLAYTYPCPRSHQELLDIVKDVSEEQLPTIIQRIRALHHPSLSASNKEAMADFSTALVEHLSYMGTEKYSLSTAEQVIRHLHSLSRTYPEAIANAFRRHLRLAYERKDLHSGDLVILTAIGSIYPTSDHFHQVVTPAMTLLARWLAMNTPDSEQKHTTGAFLVALCVRYQKLSKRYIPEAMRFTLRAITFDNEHRTPHLENLMSMANLRKDKPAFHEIFKPASNLLPKLDAKHEHRTLQILLQQSRLRRRPLELHHHRPQPIRTSIPKFESSFNPDFHYDPDKDRSDARKLQKEYKRERKGALRELRKDANFVARQQLSEKRARDAEYERKQRRLIAEIQGEEGHEAKEYEREKRRRKRKG